MRAGEPVQAELCGPPTEGASGSVPSSMAVVASMRRHGIRFTAGNYAVWHAFLSGTNPILKRAIEIVLSNGGTIEQTALHRLYARHFCPNQGALGLVRTAQSSLDQISQARALTAFPQTPETLADLAARLEAAAAHASELLAVAQVLMSRLAQSDERTALLESYLNDATRDASTDSLTGLCNRRAFDAAMRSMAADAMNSGASLAFVLIDVDHFKRVNDTWGHPIGDEVLRHVAATLTRTVRGRDLVARYGGEEFAVILGQTGRRGALAVAENLREAFSLHPFMAIAGAGSEAAEAELRITVSAGISCYTPGEAISDWVGRADRALYRAKRSGRNRVVFESAGTASRQLAEHPARDAGPIQVPLTAHPSFVGLPEPPTRPWSPAE